MVGDARGRGTALHTNANWRLFKGQTEASTPDTTAWRGVNFNDAAFADAPAPSGTMPRAILPPCPAAPGSPTAECIHLHLPPAKLRAHQYQRVQRIAVRAMIDDGYVVWINGTEVQRVNVGTPGSAVSISTLATGATEPVRSSSLICSTRPAISQSAPTSSPCRSSTRR